MFCSQCGSENLLHVKFCNKCGNNLGQSSEKVQQDLIEGSEVLKELEPDQEESLETKTNAVEKDETIGQVFHHENTRQKKYFHKRRLLSILSGIVLLGLALFLLMDKGSSTISSDGKAVFEPNTTKRDELISATLLVNKEKSYFHDQPEENTKQNVYCILGDVLTVIETSGDWVLVTYSGNNTTSEGWMLRSDLTEEMSTIKLEAGIATSLVDELRVRAKPGLNQEVVGKMNTGETAIFLQEKTEFLTSVTIRNTDYTEPWYYIRLENGNVGWVHGCCIAITSNYEYDQQSPNEKEMNQIEDSQYNFQIDENSAKNEVEVNLSNVGVWIGHSRYTSNPNSCIIILSDYTWQSSSEGVHGNTTYAAGSWYGEAEDFVLENELNTSVSMDGRVSEDGTTLYIRFQGFADVIKFERLAEEKKSDVRRPYWEGKF